MMIDRKYMAIKDYKDIKENEVVRLNQKKCTDECSFEEYDCHGKYKGHCINKLYAQGIIVRII